MARLRKGNEEVGLNGDVFQDVDFVFLKRNFGLAGVKIRTIVFRKPPPPEQPSPTRPVKY